MKRIVMGAALAFVFGAAQAADIVDTAKPAGSFNTLVAAVQGAGLMDTLKGPSPFTVFAPTAEPFAKTPKEKLDALLKDKEALTKVLAQRVLPGRVVAADVKMGAVKTIEGSPLSVSMKGGKAGVNNANVVKANVAADNGVIHVIDSVVMPN
jgi:uncharacterized surface protein with fasciclin (FAS1) repeats